MTRLMNNCYNHLLISWSCIRVCFTFYKRRIRRLTLSYPTIPLFYFILFNVRYLKIHSSSNVILFGNNEQKHHTFKSFFKDIVISLM